MAYYILSNMLKEELARLLVLEKKYIEYINQCPKGSIAIKKRSNAAYAYLAFREKNRVVFKYIGPKDSDKVQIFKKKLEKCREHNIKLRAVKADIKHIQRILALRPLRKVKA